MNILAEAATGLDALWVKLLASVILIGVGYVACMLFPPKFVKKKIEAGLKIDLDG